MMPILLILLVLSVATFAKAMPAGNIRTGNTAVKIPLMPPVHHNSPSLNPEDITLFTNMFLNLFKGIGDWRNQVAVETVQSVWQSPPIVDYSHRLFGA